MSSAILYPMNVSFVQTLSRLDNYLNHANVKTLDELSIKNPKRDLAIFTSFIQAIDLNPANNISSTSSEAQVELNETNRSRFVKILNRLIHSQEGMSRQEQTFIAKFWKELRKL